MPFETPCPSLRWEIFCRVIDNFGDVGVCWRLACNLAQRGQTVRLWVDDPNALTWMAPHGFSGVEVRQWASPIDLTATVVGDVLVEAFGCEVGPEFIACYADSMGARGQNSIWINLEYLSAEGFVARYHGLPSPVMRGPGAGLTKHFFYPGFTARTGGLLREPDLATRQGQFDRHAWLVQHGVSNPGQRVVSLFCYEPSGLGELLDTLATDAKPSCLLVTQGRASAAVYAEIERKNALQPLWNGRGVLSFVYLPTLAQADFDHLLWSCDLNFVRGEDSLVRAIWAGQPFVWQIYPQDDAAHHAKLDAFLDWLQAPNHFRQWHHWWNQAPVSDQNGSSRGKETPATHPQKTLTPQLGLAAEHLDSWRNCVQAARDQLMAQPDLATQLLGFVTKKH
jgi:uncharacterized repeat protein (TIGR03837 family)